MFNVLGYFLQSSPYKSRKQDTHTSPTIPFPGIQHCSGLSRMSGYAALSKRILGLFHEKRSELLNIPLSGKTTGGFEKHPYRHIRLHFMRIRPALRGRSSAPKTYWILLPDTGGSAPAYDRRRVFRRYCHSPSPSEPTHRNPSRQQVQG